MRNLYEKEKRIVSLLGKKLGKAVADKYIIYYFDETPSTMDVASSLSCDKLGSITIITTDLQTRGKGRFSRSWFSTSNDLTLSIVLREYNAGAPYSLISSYSAYRTLRSYGADVYLKWVNDIYWANGRKIGGVLLEDKGDRLIIGIGINLNTEDFPDELKDKATSFFIEKNVKVDKLIFLIDLLSNFDSDLYQLYNAGPENLIEEWEKGSIMQGRIVRVVTSERTYEGVCMGINKKTGFLILRVGDEILEIFDAEKVFVRPLPP